MTGRKVLFYFVHESHRPDFQGAHIGIFHKWGEWDHKSVGLVESTEGRIYMVHPEGIKFIEKYNDFGGKRKKTNTFKKDSSSS
jgi:hypothetical protein